MEDPDKQETLKGTDSKHAQLFHEADLKHHPETADVKHEPWAAQLCHNDPPEFYNDLEKADGDEARTRSRRKGKVTVAEEQEPLAPGKGKGKSKDKGDDKSLNVALGPAPSCPFLPPDVVTPPYELTPATWEL